MFWFLFFLAVIAAVYGIGTAVSVLGWMIAFILAIPVLLIMMVVAASFLSSR